MSREFHVVSPEMWNDERFRALSDPAKLLWARLITGPEVTPLPGLIAIGRAALAEAMGWSLRKFDAAFAELERTGDAHPVPMAVKDWRARVIFLPRRTRHVRRPKNPNEVTGWRDFWKVVPECALKREGGAAILDFLSGIGSNLVEAFEAFAFAGRLPVASAPIPNVSTLPDPDTETIAKQIDGSTPNKDPLYLARARARVRSDSPSPSSVSLSERSTLQEDGPPSAPAQAPEPRPVPSIAPAPPGMTPPPEDIELTQELRDECVMNGWPEPTKDHVRAFLNNARSKAQFFADWTARFKWWMGEEKKRMGRRPLDGPRSPAPAKTKASPYHDEWVPPKGEAPGLPPKSWVPPEERDAARTAAKAAVSDPGSGVRVPEPKAARGAKC